MLLPQGPPGQAKRTCEGSAVNALHGREGILAWPAPASHWQMSQRFQTVTKGWEPQSSSPAAAFAAKRAPMLLVRALLQLR